MFISHYLGMWGGEKAKEGSGRDTAFPSAWGGGVAAAVAAFVTLLLAMGKGVMEQSPWHNGLCGGSLSVEAFLSSKARITRV